MLGSHDGIVVFVSYTVVLLCEIVLSSKLYVAWAGDDDILVKRLREQPRFAMDGKVRRNSIGLYSLLTRLFWKPHRTYLATPTTQVRCSRNCYYDTEKPRKTF